jgi:galactokinase
MARASWFVPGRVELLGKHVDYLGGRSLTCATPWGLTVVAERVPGVGTLPGRDDVYAQAVVRRLTRDFGALRYDAVVAVTSTLPPGAGMSSSSAYVLGLLMALSWANDLSGRSLWRDAGLWRPMAFAEYAAAIEGGTAFGPFAGDDGVGTLGGAQDHVAIVANAPGRVGQFAYLPAREEALVRWPSEWRLVVIHSGVLAVKTEAAMAEYNRVAAEGRARGAARRAQFARECEVLVPSAAAAIGVGDRAGFGEAVAESQQLAETVLRNQVPETVALVKAALAAGAFAASSFGAGFGGAVWAAVGEEGVEAVLGAGAGMSEELRWSGVMVPARGMATS